MLISRVIPGYIIPVDASSLRSLEQTQLHMQFNTIQFCSPLTKNNVIVFG